MNAQRVLVVIANYGTGSLEYLRRLLAEYRLMPWQLDIVVLSDIPKDLGPDIEVRVGLPTANPWSLPFAHKQVFAERIDRYDLFIYSEDDTPVSERKIAAFLRATEALPEDEIAGFMRYEQAPDGSRHFPEAHGHFRWDPHSVRKRGEFTTAYFSNEHAGCYLITRTHLAAAIRSGGFMRGPRAGRYGMPETAATDIYAHCGLRKVICISHLEDFLVPHLPNKYVGRLGASAAEMYRQIDALCRSGCAPEGDGRWLRHETSLPRGRWSKSYYEPPSAELFRLLPADCRTVLSVGCGSGALEEPLVQRSMHITGIALDAVIAPCARDRGIEVISTDVAEGLDLLRGRRFDAILCANMLHLVADPVRLLRMLSRLMTAGGRLVVSLPNMGLVAAWRGRLWREAGYQELGNYMRTGVHLVTEDLICRWLRSAGLAAIAIERRAEGRRDLLGRMTCGLARRWLASDVYIAAGSRERAG